MLAVEHLIGKGLQQFLSLCGIDSFADAEVTGKDASDIAVEDGIRLIEGKTHDSCRCVVADSRQSTNEAVIPREMASFCNLLRRSMKVSGSAVVTQSLPEPKHLLLTRLCQTFGSRKPLGKAMVVVHPLTDLCLLQDILREHDEVGVASVAPGQVASKGLIPLL